jgi:hypothetical protein
MMAMERPVRAGVFWLVLLTFGAQGWAQAPLQAHLDSQQSEWVLGVPVEFVASVINVSSAPVQSYSAPSPLWGGISFFISEDGSTFHVFNGPEWEVAQTIDAVPGRTNLKPGEKVQASFSLLWNCSRNAKGRDPTDGFAFPHAGIYFVKVRASSPFGDLMSNVVRVKILEPHGNDAAIFASLEADKELARYYGFPNGAAGQGGKLQQLLKKYPNSSYTAAMKKALAVYARQQAEIEKEKTRSSSQQRH